MQKNWIWAPGVAVFGPPVWVSSHPPPKYAKNYLSRKLEYLSPQTCWELEVTCDTWYVTHDTWHVTCDTWHMTHDTWHMTYDMCHVTHRGWWKLCQNFRSLALMVLVWRCLQYSELKDQILNEWVTKLLVEQPGYTGSVNKIMDDNNQSAASNWFGYKELAAKRGGCRQGSLRQEDNVSSPPYKQCQSTSQPQSSPSLQPVKSSSWSLQPPASSQHASLCSIQDSSFGQETLL